MRARSLFVTALLSALTAVAQPVQPKCNTETCTFDLAFDDGNGNNLSAGGAITGAPYSGQQQFSNARTLPDGAHISSQSSGDAIYRDAKGRMRTEHHAIGNAAATNQPSPEDFIVAHITDPVAGFQYVLDPVNRIAHRMPFQSNGTWNWDRSQITDMQTAPGPDVTNESLGTQTISGVTAYGYKRTTSWTPPGRGTIVRTVESWYSPATGVALLDKQTSASDSAILTITMVNYSEAAPDLSLFQVPDGFRTVDETGPFQVVHARKSPANGDGPIGMHGPQLTGSCEQSLCTISFDPGNGNDASITGAPFSGTETHSVLNLRNSTTTATKGVARYRDSIGRLRTDPAPLNGRAVNLAQPVIRIDDPVAGYLYIVNPASQTAYRTKIAYRSNTPRPFPLQPAETRTTPRGMLVTTENLGPEMISGVSAIGQRTTTTYPIGTNMNNDKPVVQVNERWIDTRTNIAILVRNTNPEANITTAIPDYKEGDPDPTLFRVPADYKLVDETGAFTFTTPAK